MRKSYHSPIGIVGTALCYPSSCCGNDAVALVGANGSIRCLCGDAIAGVCQCAKETIDVEPVGILEASNQGVYVGQWTGGIMFDCSTLSRSLEGEWYFGRTGMGPGTTDYHGNSLLCQTNIGWQHC